MTTVLWVVLASMISYKIGRKAGITYAMMRMQDIIKEMQEIENFFKAKKDQWNEDNL